MLDLWRKFHRIAAIAFVIALLVTLAPARPAEAATRSIKIPVLMYHRIGSYASRYQVTQTAFGHQLNWLRANGYTVVSINRVYNYMYSGGTLPARPVVITFDDGTAGQWNAVRELNARGMKGTFFVMGGGNELTWYQLRQMVAQGHEIGAHSMSHPFLFVLISVSKRALKAHLAHGDFLSTGAGCAIERGNQSEPQGGRGRSGRAGGR